MRVSQRQVNSSLKTQLTKTFAQLLADLKTPDEVDTFLKDFLNESEYETFAKRLGIYYWLKKGRSYSNISENLKVSSATIAEVADNLSKKGIEMGIKKIEAEEWANKWAEKIKNFVQK